MASRLELHEVLCEILGSRNVYFQPPESVKMQYPAIVYSRRSIDNIHANNSVYMQNNSYELTLIHRDPDNDIVEKLSKLPTCKFDRHFVSDNLNHYTYTLYF
jgi:hypothetical protein